MELLKFLLGVSLIITVKTVSGEISQREKVCRKNMQSLTIIDYNVRLTPYFNEDDYKNTNIYQEFKSYFDKERAKDNLIFHGETTMTFRFKDKLNRICLHAQKNLKMSEVSTIFLYDEYYSTMSGLTYKSIWREYDEDSQIVVFHFNNIEFYNDYTYRLAITFVGSIIDHTGGFVKIFYTNNKSEKKLSIVAADFQGTGIRQMFPCWDEPDIRSKFTISIKHHRNYTALSNSPIDMQHPDNDMVWTVFEPTSNISPYQVAIVLSELNRIPNTTVWWCRQEVQEQIKFAIEMTKNITLRLKRVFYNVKFPPEVNHVVLPGFQNEGLESWGLILYRETTIVYDEKLDPIGWKFEVIRNLLRKIVHQFVDNIFDQTWWSYLWLHEGLAMFLTMEIVNEYVHSDLKDLLVVQFQRESLRLNDYYDMPLTSEVVTPSDINSLFSFTYYVKAPVIVRTFLQRMSRRDIVSHLNEYSVMYQDKPKNDSNSTIDEFFNVLQKIEKSRLNVNITERYSHWTKQKRYPILQVTRKSSENQVKIELSKKFHNTSYPDDLWIYVTYTMQKTAYITTYGLWMSPNQTIINISNIKDNGWIIFNIKQAGYYRVNYDKDNWRKLASYLISSEYLNIHVLNRAQIIDDAYYFLLNKEIDFRLFRELTNYLSKERNYVAWYPMFKIMEEISGFFPFSESTEVKEHFREILEIAIYYSIFKKMYGGYINNKTYKREEDIFTECLEQEVAKWSCTLNSPQCKTVDVYDLKWFYNMPRSKLMVINSWQEKIHCNGTMTPMNLTTWNNVLIAGKLNEDLLIFLACSENRSIIQQYQLLNFNDEPQVYIAIFHSIIARHAKNDLVLNYLLKNLRNIIPSGIKMFVAITYIINHVYTRDQLIRIYECAQNYFSGLILSYIHDNIIIRLAEIKKHIEYFNSFLKTN